MARQSGTYKLGSNLEPQMNAPLDARQRVATKADLTVAASFPYYWVGMEVYVAEEDKYYQLIDEPTTTIDSWRLRAAGSGGGGSTIEQSIEVTEAVGGLTPGKTYAAGEEMEQILRDMLNPLKYPTLTNPSATLSFASGESNLVEDGTTDIRKNIVCSFNRGSISPAYGTDGYRAGAAESYTDSVSGTAQASGTFNNVQWPASGGVSVTVAYAAGPQPKDSHGNNYDNPLPANTVTSNTIDIVKVKAFYANTTDITSIDKLPLFNHNTTKSKEFVFPPQTVANPEVFDIPASLTVTKIEVLNTLSGKFELLEGEFSITDVTHQNPAGSDVQYKRYTDNRGYNADVRTIKVTWS